MKLTRAQVKGIIQEEIVNYLLEMDSHKKTQPTTLKENMSQAFSQISEEEYYDTWAQVGLSKSEEQAAVKAVAQAIVEASQMDSEMGIAAEAVEYGLNTDRVVELVPEWHELDERQKIVTMVTFMQRVRLMISAMESGRMVGFGDQEKWEPGRRGRGVSFYEPETLVALARLFLKKSFTSAELARTIFGNDVNNPNQRGNHVLDALYKTRILETGKSTGKKSFIKKLGTTGTSQAPGTTSKRQRPSSFNIDDFLEESSNPLANKLRELDHTGRAAALEAKLSALDEMIDEANERLTRIDEDEEFNEMMDKGKVNNIRREVKQLEKTREKLQKEYDKMNDKGVKGKKVVDEEEKSFDEKTPEEMSPEDTKNLALKQAGLGNLDETVERMQKLAGIIKG